MRVPMRFLGKCASKSIQASPLCRRTITAVATLALVVGGILASIPTAAAPTANIFSKRILMPSASKSVILACGGVCPGICPCPSTLTVGDMVHL